MATNYRNLKRGTVFLVLLTVLPLIPWMFTQPLAARFADPLTALKSVSQVSALLGTVLFALGTLLSVSPYFASFFYSDTQSLHRARRFSGVVALLLLLAHPIVLAIKFVPHATSDAMRFLLPAGDWAFNFGVYALVLLLALYGIRFLARGDGRLSRIPLVMGVVLFFGTLHAFFIPSDISQNILLKLYVLSVVGFVLAVCLYQFSFAQKSRGRRSVLHMKRLLWGER
jgi:predicted ferric reductase